MPYFKCAHVTLNMLVNAKNAYSWLVNKVLLNILLWVVWITASEKLRSGLHEYLLLSFYDDVITYPYPNNL